MVLLVPTCLKKRQVKAIATMVTGDLAAGPPKAKVGCPKKNMMNVVAKSSGQKSILGIGCLAASLMIGTVLVSD